MHFSAPTPWQSYLFCKGLRIKQPCFEEPVFEYASSVFVPLQETQARGERMNAMCKSCGHHLSGFPNSRYLDISRTDSRSLAPIASPDGINTQLSGVYSDFKHLYMILPPLTSSTWGFIHLNPPPRKTLVQRAMLRGAVPTRDPCRGHNVPTDGAARPGKAGELLYSSASFEMYIDFYFSHLLAAKTRTFPVFSSCCNQDIAKLGLS